MIIVSLNYTASLDAVDAVIPAHIEWLKKGYDDGLFLASGRKIPRTGGIILSDCDRKIVEDYCLQDPFIKKGVAEVDITEVAFSMTAPSLSFLQPEE